MFDKVPEQEFWVGLVAALLIGGAVAASITRYAVHQHELHQLISPRTIHYLAPVASSRSSGRRGADILSDTTAFCFRSVTL
jgi:hypothetical protein